MKKLISFLKSLISKVKEWIWLSIGWKVVDICRSIQNLIKWFPIIYRDRNWDHSFIFTILKFKLQNQAKYIGEEDRHIRAKRDAEVMNTCVRLIEKVEDEYYSMEYMDYKKDKWWFEPYFELYEIKNENIEENFEDYFKKYPLIYRRVLNGEGPFNIQGKEDNKQIIAMNIGYINHTRAKKLLFSTLEYNIEGWWN